MRKNNKDRQLAVCITDTEPDLVRRKIYQVKPDEAAAKDNYVRIIDESGEDYLYPANHFVFIDVPQAERKQLLAS